MESIPLEHLGRASGAVGYEIGKRDGAAQERREIIEDLRSYFIGWSHWFNNPRIEWAFNKAIGIIEQRSQQPDTNVSLPQQEKP